MSLPETQLPLVIRLRDPADQTAWAGFVAAYSPFLTAFFQARGLQLADAHDLTQQVLLSVARSVGDWSPDGRPESFRRWLLTIARNVALKFLQRDLRRPRSDGGTGFQHWLQDQPADGTSASEQATVALQQFRQAVFRFGLQQIRPEFRDATWAAFWRTAIGQEPVAVVADSLGLTAGAIYMARSRVMARLRDFARQFDPDEFSPWEDAEP